MLFLRQAGAAIVLVMLTLGTQSAGMAGLIEWAKSHFARGRQAPGSRGSAVLVVREPAHRGRRINQKPSVSVVVVRSLYPGQP
jgi:hypothetical protein